MRRYLRWVANRLPTSVVRSLKRWRYRRLLDRPRVVPGEPELSALSRMVQPGDWVLDIGANIGDYTVQLSRLVGPEGRVLSFEPIPETFGYLASTVQALGLRNVTLLNLAASESSGPVAMSVPVELGQGANFCLASIQTDGEFSVYAVDVDRLGLEHRVALVKVDAEGHEVSVLRGMRELLERDHPTVIFEANGPARSFLESLGYEFRKNPASANLVAEFPRAHQPAGAG